MREELLVFGQPQIEEPEIREVVGCLKRAWLGTGPKVHEFEQDFARYKGVSHAAAVNSCTAALHLACTALRLSSGDEVITSANTFCATVNAIIHARATPVLADIDPSTLNIDPRSIESAITTRTRAILPVHFGGRPCDMDPIMDIAEEHGLEVVEDCAHAIETEYHSQHAGTFGRLGCFSFYATKNVVTGEGGMVIGSDREMIDRIKIMALHGLSADAWSRFSDSGYRHYFVEDIGFKYNMMDLQAALGIHQLRRVESNWARRQQIWDRYTRELGDLPIGIPASPAPDTRHAYHLFTIRVSEPRTGIDRDSFLDRMTRANIGVGVHYMSIPEHPFYRRKFGWDPEHYPHALAYGRETVSLPLSPKLTDDDASDVIAAVRKILKSP